MEDAKARKKLYRSTVMSGFVQLLSISICTAVLLLFVALTYSRITLPEYTSKYAQKDTQQVVNLLIVRTRTGALTQVDFLPEPNTTLFPLMGRS